MARPYFLDFALACYANLAIEMYVMLKVITSINQNTPSPRIIRILLVRKSSSAKFKNSNIHLSLIHVIWTERQMTNLVLNVCFDFFS